MKTIFPTFWLCLVFLSTQAQNFSNPVEYNNFIVEEQSKVVARNLQYMSFSVHSNDYQAIEQRRLAVTQQLKKSIRRVSAMPSYEGDNKLKEGMLNALELYLEAFTIEFNEANLLKAKSEESYEAMEDYFEAQDKAEKKLKRAAEKVDKAQIAFAEKNDMQIRREGNASDGLSVVSEVNEYSRKVFLAYFKTSKSNAGFYDAMGEQKAALMEKKRQELMKSTSESFLQLRGIGPFKGDKAYRDITVKLVGYFQAMAKKEYAELVRITEKDKNLTQADVDKYNQIIDKMNNKSAELVNQFNIEQNRLLQKHIPNLTGKQPASPKSKQTKKI